MLYNIRCKKGDKTVRTIKDVQGHQLVHGAHGLLLVHLANDERLFVNFDHFDFLDFSNGWAKGEEKVAQAKAQAEAAKEGKDEPVITGPGGSS